MTPDAHATEVNADDPSVQLARLAAIAADDKGATDVLVLTVGDILGVCEYFVVATGRNDRQVKAISEAVEERAAATLDRRPSAVEGLSERRWVLMDYGDVIVHVFHVEERDFYRIERLYSDAPVVEWTTQRVAGAPGE